MQQEYIDWIDTQVDEPLGRCRYYSKLMARAFPELVITRGHYNCPIWGPREHWWLTTADGEVVDPTAHQFPSAGLGDYEPWVEGSEEPIGKCLECGSYCWESDGGTSNFCSKSCERAFMGSMGLTPLGNGRWR